ncbi:proteinrelated to ribosomal protein YmL11 precursor, mitochondrial [Metarhizium robertsii ARSEF 23]|uniref:Proteinrelated to ribosomal protein YmL11, mitochondrial n=2 Tax=Metarhizium robertsii TaxID=568076 RepID=E9ELS9_METRA|nr:proteinrelated to ribosomal protein YmL11 precursor, mitochondrial [Metarhizium robertsii ARSEF 23]EFZ03188.2 proteinrelated to ribosomal protein YmL11 precursor, mitochondrial [Metarhizium robertsii ARSEF 23]
MCFQSSRLLNAGVPGHSLLSEKMVRGMDKATRSCLRLLLSKQRAPSQQVERFKSFSSTTSFATASQATIDTAKFCPGDYDNAPVTKPASARPIDTRKSQLIRTYTSLLRTTPLMLFFQHSNLTAIEWAAVRRELKKAIDAVPKPSQPSGLGFADLSSRMQLQVVRTNMFSVALRIVEFYSPHVSKTSLSAQVASQGQPAHDLSKMAYEAIREATVPADSAFAQLQPLMVGPIAVLVLPAVSPAHLAAALTILSPVPGVFPAPTRKKSPGYHDPICQNGLAKLLLVGGRIEGQIFDQAGVNWVGGIQGGVDGLRAQLINTLQGAGLGITEALKGGSRSIWLALEGRRLQLDCGDEKSQS